MHVPPWITTDLRVSPSSWTDCVRLCVQFGQICILSEAPISCVAFALRWSHAFLLSPPPDSCHLALFLWWLDENEGADQEGIQMEPSEPCRVLGPQRQHDVTLAAHRPQFLLDGSEAMIDLHKCKIIIFSYCPVTVRAQNV